MNDREFLEWIAAELTSDAATRVREIARRLDTPTIEVVEQQTLVRKSPSAPDGWSWQDIGPFTGYFSGIRLQKGEPIIEQHGHTLFIRQAEVSFGQRQQPIYEQISSLSLQNNWELDAALAAMTPEERALKEPMLEYRRDMSWVKAAAVLVVHGFQGAREGMTWFRDGKQLPTRMVGGPEEITASITEWLKYAQQHPLVARKRPPREVKTESLL